MAGTVIHIPLNCTCFWTEGPTGLLVGGLFLNWLALNLQVKFITSASGSQTLLSGGLGSAVNQGFRPDCRPPQVLEKTVGLVHFVRYKSNLAMFCLSSQFEDTGDHRGEGHAVGKAYSRSIGCSWLHCIHSQEAETDACSLSAYSVRDLCPWNGAAHS